ncbi:hypothetical protein X975_14019, partial [Stegodyphus mimosarum]
MSFYILKPKTTNNFSTRYGMWINGIMNMLMRGSIFFTRNYIYSKKF